MRMSRAAKASTHTRIVRAASRLVRERGVEGAGVADVMRAAGLTAGGFYRHFSTKEALLAAALPAAFEDFAARVMDYLIRQPPGNFGESFQAFYLSSLHADDIGTGCPMAALGSDIARASPRLKAAFGEGLSNVIAVLSQAFDTQNRRQMATRQIAMLVGAVILARASDPATAEDVLSACQSVPDRTHVSS